MKRKTKKYLVTGGTGFLGQHVIGLLQEEADIDIISRSGKTGVKGDLSRWQGGIDIEALQGRNYDAFIHLAGLYDLSATQSDVHMNNVVGTNTALQIAAALRIPAFLNASSIAAASNQTADTVSAYDLNFSMPFPDPYSESKALAEQLIQNWLGPIPLRVNLRLGILVGDTVNGKILRSDGPYHVAESLTIVKSWLNRWKWPLPVPGNPDVRLPLVPVNQAALAVAELSKWASQYDQTGYRSFNIVPKYGVSIEELYRSTFNHLGLSHIQFKMIKKVPQNVLAKIGTLAFNLPEEQLRYALSLPKYESETTRQILGSSWCSEFSDYENIYWRGYEEYISNR